MKIIKCTILFLFSISAFSQTKIDLKINEKDLKNANLYFETEDYLNAIEKYKKILAIDPFNEIANLNSGICRIRLGQSVDSCLMYSEKLKLSKIPEVQFYFGQMFHLKLQFDEAIHSFNSYKAIPEKQRKILNTEVDYYISCSKNAKDFINNPQQSIVKNMGNNINSAYADYFPLISPDESYIYFTSRRIGSTGNLKDVYSNYYEGVYQSQHLLNGEWSKPKNIGSPINSNTHDACVSLSTDANSMIIYRTTPDLLTGDLYFSYYDKFVWSEPQKFGPEINTPFIETSACFSNDTSIIYFSSNRPGGFGGKDIYRIKRLPNGKWAMPMNLGPHVNTNKDEDTPFMHPDGNTLYFSSKGHNTMGEYDVFKTVLNIETSKFSVAQNLGYPINSVTNDLSFVLNAKGNTGYYSSIKDETFGNTDIYKIEMHNGDPELKVKQGKILIDNQISKAKITLLDLESKLISGIFNASSKTGKFLLVMNPYKSYKAIIEEESCYPMIIDIEPVINERTEIDIIINLIKKK